MHLLTPAISALKKLLNFAYGAAVMRSLAMRHRAVLAELRPLAVHLEQEVSPRRRAGGFYFNMLLVTETGLSLNESPEDSAHVAHCHHLLDTLRRMGVHRVELDVQLEEGQIAEALLLLFHAHRHLAEASPPAQEYTGWSGRGTAGQLLTEQGFHKFCFLLHYDQEQGIFRTTYSYCELPLSMFVHQYVQNHAKYGDHRALFRAAPRVAGFVLLLTALPAVLYVWNPGAAFALFGVLGVLSAMAAGVTLYTLGSIQYTREHHDIMLKRHVVEIEKLSRFPQANPNVVMELSTAGEVLYVNPVGKKLLDELGVPEDDLEELLSPGYRDLIRDSLDTPGQAFRDEAVARGRAFNCHYVSFPNGESVILAAVEITYLKQIEADLREAHALSEARKAQIAEAYRQLDAEFEIIGDIQRSLLPTEIPEVAGLEIATHYETCQRAGGDYYDFFALRNGNLGILIADVSGHGSPAAVLMAITHTIAHLLHEDPMQSDPDAVIGHINTTLVRHYQHRGDFVTAVYGVYDPRESTFSYASAGHNPPAYARADNGNVDFLPKQCGIPLGILESARFEVVEVCLAAGDCILLYTDGITEAMNRDQKLFSETRLLAALRASDGGAADRVGHLLSAVDQFVGDEALNDDRTVVFLRGTGSVPDNRGR